MESYLGAVLAVLGEGGRAESYVSYQLLDPAKHLQNNMVQPGSQRPLLFGRLAFASWSGMSYCQDQYEPKI